MLVHIQGVLIPSTTTFQKEFFSETHITEYSKSKTTTKVNITLDISKWQPKNWFLFHINNFGHEIWKNEQTNEKHFSNVVFQ